MCKLVFGKAGQVSFESEAEKKVAIDYILTSKNVEMYIEPNQERGAWAQEYRISFKENSEIPECLQRIMTSGNSGCYGRINCKEFYEEVLKEKEERTTQIQ